MNCDMELHEGLIELGDVVCPFCKRTLGDEKPRDRSVNIIYAVFVRISSTTMG